MKRYIVLAIALIGLFATKVCFAAGTSVFTWEASDTAALTGQMIQAWTDFKIPVLLVVGVVVGLVLIRKAIGLIKGGIR